MTKKLVVNGCSYMDMYARGKGHVDLAERLNIPTAESIAKFGGNNSRILRTTLKHSYAETESVLYVIGMTFISRLEVPILETADPFNGKWVNPQNTNHELWDHHWKPKHREQYIELSKMIEVYSLPDRTEDLMYNTLSMIESLESRGHRVVIFQYVDDSYFCFLNTPQLSLFQSKKNFINGFGWTAIQYQNEHGVEKVSYPGVPEQIQKPVPGSHTVLNSFLADYINANI